MKIKYLALSVLACGALLSCSNDDDITAGGGEATTGSQYMAVNLTMGTSTRATGDFENGTTNECAIKPTNCAFFFYDEYGNYLTKGTLHTQATDIESDFLILADDATNNLQRSKAIVVLEKTQLTPKQVLAVLNVSNTSSFESKTLAEAKALLVLDTKAWGNTAGTFVMTNATVAGDISATAVTKNNFQTTAADAINHPVVIRVERVAAKLGVYKGTSDVTQSVTLTEKVNLNGSETTFKIKIDGWRVNAINNKSYYVKKLKPTWEASTNAPFTDWTGTNRTFWAEDVNYDTDATTDLEYFTWTEAKEEKIGDVVYLHENTIDQSKKVNSPNTKPNVTTVLVAAHIVYNTGSGSDQNENGDQDIFKRGGYYYTTDGLKNLIASNSDYYWYDASGRESWTRLSKDDITLSFDDASLPADAEIGQVNITVTFADGTNTKTLVQGNGSKASVDKSTAATALGNSSYAQRVLMYKGGACYYQVPIVHAASDICGIVRNHSYKLKIDNITGIGGPVDDKEEDLEIIPGDEKDYYIACSLQVLDWRVVEQSVTLK